MNWRLRLSLNLEFSVIIYFEKFSFLIIRQTWFLLNAKLNCFYVVTGFLYHLVTSLAGGVYMTRWHGSVNNRCVNFSRPLLGDQEVGKLSSNV